MLDKTSNLKWGYTSVVCRKCHHRLRIRIGQKYRFCPFCNKNIKLR